MGREPRYRRAARATGVSQVSISEAARLVGKDRKTLYRDIKSGRLSATTCHSGTRQVDIAELVRVYGEFATGCHSGKSGATPQDATPLATNETVDLLVKVSALEVEVNQLRERLKEKDGYIEKQDGHIEDLRRSIKLLAAPPKPEPEPEDSWWKFWRW